MTDALWPPGAATGIGSLPGNDPREAATTVLGELPDLPHLPELPARGLGADLIGRTAAMLVDLAIEVVPSGYRVTARPGGDHRRAVDLLSMDLDAFEEACESLHPQWVKVQAAGPWTLAACVELVTGHRVLTDHGARREFAASLTEGLALHAAEVAERTGARVAIQLDEPALPAVLAGSLPTASGLTNINPVPASDAAQALSDMIAALPGPVIVHSCATDPPIELLRRAGAQALSFDATLPMSKDTLDALGQAWDDGLTLLLGLVPAIAPAEEPTLRKVAQPALDLADRLGFGRDRLAELAVPTPTCGLSGADTGWAQRAMALSRDLGRAFVDPPDIW
ncbi:MAG: methionine synthase [Pseudonocardia sp.]